MENSRNTALDTPSETVLPTEAPLSNGGVPNNGKPTGHLGSPPHPSAIPDPSEWLDEYGDYLYRYAFLRVNSPETAEDLVQETLLAAVRGFENFEGRSSVKTWLVGILKNKIIDYMRRASRKERKEVLEEDAEIFDRHFNRFGIWNRVLPNWAQSPNEILENKEFLETFESCLKKVTRKAQKAFVLKTFENIESDEICKILDITPSNLWVLLHRCRLSLRECIEKNWAMQEEETPS